jgi:hypothetical protein
MPQIKSRFHVGDIVQNKWKGWYAEVLDSEHYHHDKHEGFILTVRIFKSRNGTPMRKPERQRWVREWNAAWFRLIKSKNSQ